MRDFAGLSPAFDSLGRLRFLRLELRDDGCGFDPAKRYDGFGLLGIKERIESMGGELTVQAHLKMGRRSWWSFL
jgi:glucose-6-phosphate-specific signal transduction histidine kinase